MRLRPLLCSTAAMLTFAGTCFARTVPALTAERAPLPGSASAYVMLYGGKGSDFLRTAICRNSDCYLYGRTFGSFASDEDYLAIRVLPSGAPIWARAYGGTNADELRSAAPAPDGGALLIGNSTSLFHTPLKALSPHKWPRPLLVRIDSDGKIEWAATVEMSGPTWRMDLESGVQTADGGFLLAGNYKEWKLSYAQKSLQTQEWMVAGKVYPPPSDAPMDAILIRIDANGKLKWLRRYELQDKRYSHYSQAWQILPRSGGSFLVTLYDGSDDRTVLMTVDEHGKLLHAETLDGVGDGGPADILSRADGGFVLFAHLRQNKRYVAALVADFSDTGKLQAARRYADSDFAVLQAARYGDSGAYCVAGRRGSGSKSRAQALLVPPAGSSSRALAIDSDAATEFFSTTQLGTGCLMAGSTMAFGAAAADILTITWPMRAGTTQGPTAQSVPGAQMHKADVSVIDLKPRRVMDPVPANDIRLTKIPVPATTSNGALATRP